MVALEKFMLKLDNIATEAFRGFEEHSHKKAFAEQSCYVQLFFCWAVFRDATCECLQVIIFASAINRPSAFVES